MEQHDEKVAPIPSPLRLFSTVLAIGFLAEATVMFVLPVLLPHAHTVAAAIADAVAVVVLRKLAIITVTL